jgi:predicted dinucleotide-binding enzyme
MNIGILGAGNIGATAARLFVAAGHDVAVSNSRGPDSLRQLISELGPQAHAMTIRDAARFGEYCSLFRGARQRPCRNLSCCATRS